MTKKQNLLKTKNAEELTTLLAKERGELRTLRFAAAGSRPKDSSSPMKTRREIARIMTELHQKKTVAKAAAKA